MTTELETPGQVNCPSCNTLIYMYNQHTCIECSAEICFYCETVHMDQHKEEDAKVPE